MENCAFGRTSDKKRVGLWHQLRSVQFLQGLSLYTLILNVHSGDGATKRLGGAGGLVSFWTIVRILVRKAHRKLNFFDAKIDGTGYTKMDGSGQFCQNRWK